MERIAFEIEEQVAELRARQQSEPATPLDRKQLGAMDAGLFCLFLETRLRRKLRHRLFANAFDMCAGRQTCQARHGTDAGSLKLQELARPQASDKYWAVCLSPLVRAPRLIVATLTCGAFQGAGVLGFGFGE